MTKPNGMCATKSAHLGRGHLDGARKASLPRTVKPSLAKLVESAPEGDQWLHEIKFDGYRMLGRIDRKRVRLISRHGVDWTERFAAIAADLVQLNVENAFIDGEIVAMDERGASSFSALQEALSEGSTNGLIYVAFDLLHLDGYDLRHCALEDRKNLLASCLAGAGSRISYCEHVIGKGPAFFRAAYKERLEGIVSKRRTGTYQSGRRTWLKTKCSYREDFAVIGYTNAGRAPTGLGSLILGYYDAAGTLHGAGTVGTGFSAKTLRDLRQRLDALPPVPCPLKTLPASLSRMSRWVDPNLVAEVRYAEWTSGGSLRHPAFLRLRDDKTAREVVRQMPAA